MPLSGHPAPSPDRGPSAEVGSAAAATGGAQPPRSGGRAPWTAAARRERRAHRAARSAAAKAEAKADAAREAAVAADIAAAQAELAATEAAAATQAATEESTLPADPYAAPLAPTPESMPLPRAMAAPAPDDARLPSSGPVVDFAAVLDRKRLRLVAIGASVAVLTLAGAVLVDTALGSGRTARRLTLSTRDIGRMDEPELRAAVDGLADELADRTITLRGEAGDVPLPARTLGVELDRAAVVQAARDMDHDRPFFLRPLLTLRSWFFGQEVPLRYTVDRAVAAAGAADAGAANSRPPTEPNIVLQGDTFAAVPGSDGHQLDIDTLAARLHVTANTYPDGPWVVELPWTPVPPRYGLEEAQRLAERANGVARSPLTVVAGGKRATVPAAKVRSWLRAVPADDAQQAAGAGGLQLQADVEAVIRDVTAAVGTVGSPPTDASFRVVGDRVETVPGKAGTKCCAPDTGTRVADAVLNGRNSVTLDLVDLPAKQDKAWVEKLGIQEKVASFTSKHPAGQPRVTNIHIAADALRGAVIEPGGTLSLNGRLGPRTAAKGYVPAGVIMYGKMDTDIGGGVSQLTTTLFNAAFFAGLDVPVYQSHTIYIDRYPYGREATLSYPSPDLKIRNPSPHGVLVWTSYDDTSITVSLYSTKWATGEQTNQTKEPKGTCTKVRTERTRTYVSGKKDVDYFTATYQQEEGLLCDGRRTNTPPEDRPDATEGAPKPPEGGPPAPPSTPPPPPTTAAPSGASATTKAAAA